MSAKISCTEVAIPRIMQRMNRRKASGKHCGCTSAEELMKFNDQLLNGESMIGRIISVENIRRSSENINHAIINAIVNNGHGVLLQR
jgi:hypothetical protein